MNEILAVCDPGLVEPKTGSAHGSAAQGAALSGGLTGVKAARLRGQPQAVQYPPGGNQSSNEILPSRIRGRVTRGIHHR